MQRFGDDTKGFSIEFVSKTNTLDIRGWGFWTAPLSMSFGKAVMDACKTLPHGTVLNFNLLELKTLREEGQLAVGVILEAWARTGAPRSIRIASNSGLTRLQILRIAKERGALDVVELSEADLKQTGT